MADDHQSSTPERTVYTGTVRDYDTGGERSVRIVEAPEAPKKYPFGWGVVAFAPSLFAPARRPLFYYDLLLVGLPTVQSRMLAYLMRRQVAERIMGSWQIPMPPWDQVAWELGSEAKLVRRAFAMLAKIRVVAEVGTKPRRAVVSPFVHYVGAMDQLRARWRQLYEEWTPTEDAWRDFWSTAPARAQMTKIARQVATQAGAESADVGDDDDLGFPEEWAQGLCQDDGPYIDHSLDPELVPHGRKK